MTRIVLERKQQPRRPQLPPYVEIDQAEIREAAAAWDAGKAALDSARKDLTELEQTREAAEWRDAEAAEKARAEGKAEPKRTQVAAHDKQLDEARHELKVSELAEERTFNTLQVALDEHADEWAQSIEVDAQQLADEWAEVVAKITSVHAQRARVYAIRSMIVGGEQPGVAALGFTPRQLQGLDVHAAAVDIETGKRLPQVGWVSMGDVIAGLTDLGGPAEPPAEPVKHPPLKPMFRADSAEARQRREFNAQAQSPEHVAAREAKARERRERREAEAAAIAAGERF